MMSSKDYYDLLHEKFDGTTNKEGLYPAENTEYRLYDTLANFHIATSLYIGSLEDEAKALADNIENSRLKNKDGFYNRQATERDVVARHHSCIEGVASFFYGISKSQKRGFGILKRLFNSPLYNNEQNLFYMSMDESGNIVDERLITHSQLWIVLALIVNGQHERATGLLSSVRKQCITVDIGILETMYCASTSTEKVTLPDDTALFAIASFLIGERDEAVKTLVRLKNSPLFDNKRNVFVYKTMRGQERISSYKNLLCQAAFKLCGVEIPPYDIKNEERFADSIALGIFAVCIDKIKSRTNSFVVRDGQVI